MAEEISDGMFVAGMLSEELWRVPRGRSNIAGTLFDELPDCPVASAAHPARWILEFSQGTRK